MATNSKSKTPLDYHRAAERQARTPLTLKAYDTLRGEIVASKLAPGTFLSERTLSARLGMSKTPIRTALERLATEGFVTISPQQGVVVREMSVHEVVDQFQIRAALEGFVVRMLAGKLTPAQKTRLKAQLDEQRQAAHAGDVERTVALDTEFHLLLAHFLGNAEIVRVLEQLRDKIARVILKVMRESGRERLKESFEEHRLIADAVLRGKGDLAVARLEQHLEYGKQNIMTRGRAQ